ncbi:MAG: alkaline phosphatase family protein [Fimbriimonas sp.]
MRRRASLVLLTAALALPAAANAQSRIGTKPPKLVVLISIDQYRGDYPNRFAPYFLPARSGRRLGGFKFLTETGAWYQDAHHNHLPTATGPGHATLMTGSEPTLNGIVGNTWYDRKRGRGHYVVDDSTVESIGGQNGKMSPRPLLVSTVGDELKMATNGRSKVVGVAIKDRASILMAGHAADTVIWYDASSGNWVTSSWYAKNGKLPTWVDELNKTRGIDKAFGTRWEPMLPADAYAVTRRSPTEKPSDNGKVFSWPLGTAGGTPDRGYFSGLITSHFGNEWVFDTTKRAVEAEKLGQRDVPDVLVVNLSSNDYVGHRFGPNSPEVMDVTVRTDRLLSDFFNYLDGKLGIDNVTVVLTGDHGVLPIPEEASGVYQMPSVRQPVTLSKTISEALTQAFGAGSWVLGSGLYEQNFYINRETAREKKVSMADVERVAAEAAMRHPGVYVAFTRTQILSGQVPSWAWVPRMMNGFHPELGGDLMIMEGAGVLFGGGTGTSHGSAFDYDSHVPIIIRGRGIKAGKYTRRVATADIASTLSLILGTEFPTGNIGHPLREALDK